MANNDSFDPKIIAFCCNWCSYAGADLAGSMRLKYPANVLPIRVMCSGRVSPHHVLKAFQEGAKRVAVMRQLLGFVGISPGRLRLEWVSGSEGAKFAQIMGEFTQQIRELGPSPLRKVWS